MQFSQTTPALLAEKVTSHIGSTVSYPSIRLDGAKNTVNILRNLLGN
jgi:hypothetical protein